MQHRKALGPVGLEPADGHELIDVFADTGRVIGLPGVVERLTGRFGGLARRVRLPGEPAQEALYTAPALTSGRRSAWFG